jgi:hypothetical protein
VEDAKVKSGGLAVAAVLASTLHACGGKSVTATEVARTDAATPDVHVSPTDASTIDAADSLVQDVRDAQEDEGASGPDVTDSELPWDHTCWCKNWNDDAYPNEFFNKLESCVNGPACPAPLVCCAITCTSPDYCTKTTWGFILCEQPAPNDCCLKRLRARCVSADKCAPDGVLHPQQWDSSKSSFPMCTKPPDAGY